jgi:hypothetical protein
MGQFLMNGVAVYSMTMAILAAILIPSLIGRDRGKYTYSNFIAACSEAFFVSLLALRVLGFI